MIQDVLMGMHSPVQAADPSAAHLPLIRGGWVEWVQAAKEIGERSNRH
jgi:hypothetical protein